MYDSVRQKKEDRLPDDGPFFVPNGLFSPSVRFSLFAPFLRGLAPKQKSRLDEGFFVVYVGILVRRPRRQTAAGGRHGKERGNKGHSSPQCRRDTMIVYTTHLHQRWLRRCSKVQTLFCLPPHDRRAKKAGN